MTISMIKVHDFGIWYMNKKSDKLVFKLDEKVLELFFNSRMC